MRSAKEVHEEFLSNLEVLKVLEEEKIIFGDKNAYNRLLNLVIERNNVLSWVLEI